jgi:hypothetical protein
VLDLGPKRKILLALLMIVSAHAAGADVIDRIVAVVAGQPILLSDVTAARQFQLVEIPAGATDPIAYTAERLIDRTVMLAEVERFQPPEPDPIEMTIRVDALERRAGSAAAFDRLLSITGMTRDDLRRYLRNDLRITTYLNQRFGANADAADREAAIRTWLAELRKRAGVTVLMAPRSPAAPQRFSAAGSTSAR